MKKCQRCKGDLGNRKNRYCKTCINALKKEMAYSGYLQEMPVNNGKNRGRKCLSAQRFANSEEMGIG